ncbi:LysR family transcriptional regulator [Corallincola spongiicola]|uniref:LysR family transcriptional regulator n=1 Tax=Corallincola spongiicola TaxID=2520508 RepID=A0ABY1WRH5_9GAMM|nr:LysR family transcriptional regulator [Corallincola spongiicola]TAA47326.1 LysR family transcriptional regulator [Corallincola spongiicola]
MMSKLAGHYTLEQLRVLIAAVDSGSFSAAARKLGRAQSAISHQIQNLELDLNVVLFERSGRYPQLTAAGRAILDEARFLLLRADHLSGIAASLQAKQRTRLVIAADEMALDGSFDKTMLHLSQRFPTLSVDLVHPVLEEVAAIVRNGEAQVGLTVQMSQVYDDLAFARHGMTQMVCVADPEHPLVGLSAIEVSTLSRYRQVLVSVRRQQASHWQLSPSCWHAGNIWSAVELAKMGVGWTSVPEYAARAALAQGKLKILHTTMEAPVWEQATDLIWRFDLQRDEVLKWLMGKLAGVIH